MMRRYYIGCAPMTAWFQTLCSRLISVERGLRSLEEKIDSTSNAKFLQELTRSLALTGDGARLDGSIRTCIEWYCEVRNELHRVLSNEELAETLREDIATGFRTILDRHAEALARLDVSVRDVEPGTKLDACEVLIVKELETHRKRELDKVAECLQPEFRWTNGFGQDRIEVARVSAFTTLKPRRSDKSRWADNWR